MKHTGEGGASTFSDGFRIAEEIRRSDKDAYDILARIPLPGQYLDQVRFISTFPSSY